MKPRDPKPTSPDSWWLKCRTSTELNQEAAKRFPSATVDNCPGVTLMVAKKQGTL